MRAGRRGDDLFAQQGAAAAFDQRQVGPDLVGAVDRQVELRRLVEGGERDAGALGVGAGGLRGRHADDVEAAAHTLAEQFDEMLGGRAGAEAEPHARAHEFEGPGGGGAFLKCSAFIGTGGTG